MVNERELWINCKELLLQELTDATWNLCFEGVKPTAFDGSTLTLSAPNQLVKERLETRYLGLLSSIVNKTAGSDVEVKITLDKETRPEENLVENTGPGNPKQTDTSPDLDTKVNQNISRYSFDTFIIGSSNRFAHAAALAAAENPGKSYNPLFIYGDTGLGKTHLLRAIEGYVRENFKTMIVKYVSTETFLNEFVDAIRTNMTSAFKRKYRECNVLLVDDIQFLESKDGLQEEFFHTFNSLYEASKQVVITSDRAPKALSTLEERLQSRFKHGLVTDVQPPDLETRLAILRLRVDKENLCVPEEVLQLIAEVIKDNIRELEGALTRVTAYARVTNTVLTRQSAEIILSDIISSSHRYQITPRTIQQEVAKTFGFTVDDLCSSDRHRPLVFARQVGMYVTRELTDYSYPAIAKEFGGKDHTTVIHAVDKITKEMSEKRAVYDQVTEIIRKLKNQGS